MPPDHTPLLPKANAGKTGPDPPHAPAGSRRLQPRLERDPAAADVLAVLLVCLDELSLPPGSLDVQVEPACRFQGFEEGVAVHLPRIPCGDRLARQESFFALVIPHTLSEFLLQEPGALPRERSLALDGKNVGGALRPAQHSLPLVGQRLDLAVLPDPGALVDPP